MLLYSARANVVYRHDEERALTEERAGIGFFDLGNFVLTLRETRSTLL